MLRGINKQIIEIKCPNNECFEKIMFFVKSDKYDLSDDYLKKRAGLYCKKIITKSDKSSIIKQPEFRIGVIVCAFAGLAIGCGIVWLLL